jgi:hypothetical protein
MERLHATKLIEETYSFANQPFVTRVICKNDVTFYGHFYSFDDFRELKERNQFRFIPRNNLQTFKNEHTLNGKLNLNHSLILEGDEMLSIDFVLPLHI